MKPEINNALWEELRLLNAIVSKFDEFSFRIKNWFITVFTALIAYAVLNHKPSLVMLSFAIILMFFFYELTYRVNQRDFLKRLREIQAVLRRGEEPSEHDVSPNIDKYVLMEDEGEIRGWLYELQKKFGVPETRARRNIREWRRIFIESPKILLQFRISFPYIAATLVAIFALMYTAGF